MPSAMFQIGINIVGRDKASPAFKRSKKGLDQLNRSAKNAEASFKNLAGAFTGLLVAGKIKDTIVEGFVKPAMDLQDAMSRLKVVGGVAEESLGKFGRKAKEIAKRTAFNRTEIIQGMEYITRATGSAQVALGGIETAARLAISSFGDLDMKAAAEMVGGISRAYGVEGKELYSTLNKVSYMAKTAGVPLKDLRRIMERLSMSQISANQSFDSLLQSFLLGRRIFPQSLRAQTQLFRMYQEIGKIDVQGKLQQIGVSPTDAKGKIRPVEDIFKQLYTRYTQDPDYIVSELRGVFTGVGSKAALSILQAIDKGVRIEGKKYRGANVFDAFKEAMAAAGSGKKDYIGEAEAAALKTARRQWGLLGEALKNIALQIGTKLLPPLTKFASAMKDLFNWVDDLIERFPKFLTFLSVIGGALAANLGILAVRAAKQGIIRILAVVRYNVQNANKDVGILNALLGKSVALSSAATAATTGAAAGAAAKGAAGAAAGTAAGAAAGAAGAAAAGAVAKKGILARIGGKIGATRVGAALGKVGGVVRASGALSKVVGVLGRALGWGLKLFGGLPGLLLTAGIMFAGPIWDTVSKFWGGDKPQEKLKEGADAVTDAAKAIGKSSKKLEDAGKSVKQALIIGSKKFEKLLEKAENLADYEPAIVKWQKSRAAMGVFGRAAKGGRFEDIDVTRVENMQRFMKKIKAIRDKSLRGEATPDEQAAMTSMASSVFANMKYLQRRYKGVIGEKLMEGVRDNWFKQIIKSGSAEGQTFANQIQLMGEGRRPTDKRFTPNWDASLGRYAGTSPQNIFQEYRPSLFNGPDVSGSPIKRSNYVYDWHEQGGPLHPDKATSYHGQIQMDKASEELLRLAKNQGVKVQIVGLPFGGMVPVSWSNNDTKDRVE